MKKLLSKKRLPFFGVPVEAGLTFRVFFTKTGTGFFMEKLYFIALGGFTYTSTQLVIPYIGGFTKFFMPTLTITFFRIPYSRPVALLFRALNAFAIYYYNKNVIFKF